MNLGDRKFVCASKFEDPEEVKEKANGGFADSTFGDPVGLWSHGMWRGWSLRNRSTMINRSHSKAPENEFELEIGNDLPKQKISTQTEVIVVLKHGAIAGGCFWLARFSHKIYKSDWLKPSPGSLAIDVGSLDLLSFAMVVEMFATLTQVICQSVIFLDLSVKCYNFHRATTFLFPRARDFGTAWRFNWARPVWFCVPLLPSGDANGHEAPTEGRSHITPESPHPKECHRALLWFGYFMALGNRFAWIWP